MGRGEIAIEMALHLNEIGKIEEGLSFVEVINDRTAIKTEILYDIAESLFFEKKENLALILYNRMHGIAETITFHKVDKDVAFSAVALTLAVAHESSSAQEIVNKVEALNKMQKLLDG